MEQAGQVKCRMSNYYRIMLGQKSVHAAECLSAGFIGADFDIDTAGWIGHPVVCIVFRHFRETWFGHSPANRLARYAEHR